MSSRQNGKSDCIRTGVAAVVLAIVLLAPCVRASGLPLPDLSIGQDQVVARGIHSHGTALLALMARDDLSLNRQIRQSYLLGTDNAGTGTVTFKMSYVIPTNSVVFVVDLWTGKVLTGSPTGSKFVQITFPSNALQRSTTDPDRVVLSEQLVSLVLVRPKAGEWFLQNGDGGTSDADHARDGVITWSLDGLTPLGSFLAAPTHVTANDILIALNPLTMEYASEVTQ